MKFGIPYLGQYGACSTMAQSLIMAASAVESGGAKVSACVTSSHFASAERQYRFPLEYGGVRTPTAQWTVTGAGSCILKSLKKGICVARATVGRIVDLGVSDANNMGAAMAPAAAQTLECYLEDTKTSPEDYDMIITGDLGEVGSKSLYDLLERDGINIRKQHNDCGLMIFERSNQDVHAGGSLFKNYGRFSKRTRSKHPVYGNGCAHESDIKRSGGKYPVNCTFGESEN